MTVRELINAERIKQGFTYMALSRAAGLDAASVHRFLNKSHTHNKLTLFTVLRLMKALGMDIKQVEDCDDCKEKGSDKQP